MHNSRPTYSPVVPIGFKPGPPIPPLAALQNITLDVPRYVFDGVPNWAVGSLTSASEQAATSTTVGPATEHQFKKPVIAASISNKEVQRVSEKTNKMLLVKTLNG